MSALSVYEQPELRQATGASLRPGGLDLTDRLVTLGGLRPGDRVADIGCGLGTTVAHLRARYGLAAVGVDPSAVLLAEGHGEDGQRPLARAMAGHLPFATGSLTAVLAECSLSLLDDLDGGLMELWRVLRDGGVVLMGDVYARNPAAVDALGRLPVASCVRGALPQAGWVGRFAAHGFKVSAWEDHSFAMRQFVMAVILTHGSLAWFWGRARCATGVATAPEAISAVVAQAKPGYALMAAVKPG